MLTAAEAGETIDVSLYGGEDNPCGAVRFPIAFATKYPMTTINRTQA